MKNLRYWLVLASFFILSNWCYAQIATSGCKIKGDIGTLLIEVESYNSRNGRATIVIMNSASRHVNINLSFIGTFSDGTSTFVFQKDDIYKPGKTTETITVNILYNIRTRKSEFPYTISSIRLSGADFDGYTRDLTENEKIKEGLKNAADRLRNNRN